MDYADKKILAVYHDANNNGKLDKYEKLRQASLKTYVKNFSYETANFEIQTQDGDIVPFRMLFEVRFTKNGKGKPSITWVQAGCFSGQGELDGKNFTFFLFPDTISRSYTKMCKSSYVVLPENQKMGRKFPLRDLNAKISIFDKLYLFEVLDISSNGKNMKIRLSEDTAPMADFKFDFLGKIPLKYEISYIVLKDRNGKTLKLETKDLGHKIPAREYRVVEALIHYGEKKTREYHCFWHGVKYFLADSEKSAPLIAGKPEIKMDLSINRIFSDSAPLTTNVVNVGDSVSVAIKIIGVNGESYGTMRQDDAKDGLDVNLEPQLKVTDKSGKEVDSGEMFYYVTDGNAGHTSHSWQPCTPGKYTITVTQNTGPLMGVIKAQRELTVLPSQTTSPAIIGGSDGPTTIFPSKNFLPFVHIGMILAAGILVMGCIIILWRMGEKEK